MSVPAELIDLANLMADEAGKIAHEFYRTPFDIVSKEDNSPVTIADRTIETRLREILADQRPEDGIWGEEFGHTKTRNGMTWVIDPIDGTKSFTIGRPTFGTLIGLCDGNVPVLGIIDQPVAKERWIGIEGEQTTFNGHTVSTRSCTDFQNAIFGTSEPDQIARNDASRFERFKQKCRYPVLNGDCYFYGLMANGGIDILIEDYLGIYDYIALVPVIQGAGGKITDWSGAKLGLSSGSSVLATGDPLLHEKALKLI